MDDCAEESAAEECARGDVEPGSPEKTDAATQTECGSGLICEVIDHMKIICDLLKKIPLDADVASTLHGVEADRAELADLWKAPSGTCMSVRGKGCNERRTRFCCFF